MSTFTDWNGPQGGGVRAADLIQLANAYSDLVSKLNQHMSDKTPDTSDVHGIKTYVEAQINNINIPDVSAFITEKDADGKYAAKSTIPTDYVKEATLDKYVKTSALSDYLKTNDLTSQEVITVIQTDITAIKKALSANPFEMPALKATDYVEGLIHAVEQIKFTDKDFSAPVGGSDTAGIYYILGMLENKAGTAYIKMSNTKPFSAVVNFAVTPGFKGALSVTTDCELAGLKFKIVAGTDTDNIPHAYLAVQSSEWFSHFTTSDGVGKFDSIQFSGAGINYIPVDSNGYKQPNGNCHDVCDCESGKGFSFSKLATSLLGRRIYATADNPYLTLQDVTALDHIGIISDWPFYDDNGVAVDVPGGYHACDGTDVLPDDDVSDEFRAKFTKYPLQDYAIIKTKSAIEVDASESDVDTSLAQTVAALHGIQYFDSIGQLPSSYRENEPCIVRIGDYFSVYAYTAADGWRKYSTNYNDINATIAAVAAVIAAVHHADVYTVYSSITDLPTGPSVETDALAIIFDGTGYSVFKYNGTNWEVQA